MKKYLGDLSMFLKLDRAFYIDWLSKNKKTAIQDGLHYVIGVHPDSMGTTLPDIKIKVECLEAHIRSLKDRASCSKEEECKFSKIIKDEVIVSPKDFAFLMYQCVSDFPKALREAYVHITGSQLELEENSPIRLVYKEYAKLDLWTLREACCLVSHMHPESDALNTMVGQNKELVQRCLFLPHTYTYLFPNAGLYKTNLNLAVTAIRAGKLKLAINEGGLYGAKANNPTDSSSVIPIQFLKWASTKNIKFHSALEELVLRYSSDNVQTISPLQTEYTTPYLELMKQAINELRISEENQPKSQEVLIPWFEDKLMPIEKSDKVNNKAKMMSTFVRLPESATGGNKTISKK